MGAEPNQNGGPPPDRWGVTWPKVVAMLQAGAGAYGFISQVNSTVERPWVIAASLVLLGAVPATWALDRLRGK